MAVKPIVSIPMPKIKVLKPPPPVVSAQPVKAGVIKEARKLLKTVIHEEPALAKKTSKIVKPSLPA